MLKRTLLQWGTAALEKEPLHTACCNLVQHAAARCSMLQLQYRCFQENGVNVLTRTLLQWGTAAFRKRATLYSMLQALQLAAACLKFQAALGPLDTNEVSISRASGLAVGH